MSNPLHTARFTRHDPWVMTIHLAIVQKLQWHWTKGNLWHVSEAAAIAALLWSHNHHWWPFLSIKVKSMVKPAGKVVRHLHFHFHFHFPHFLVLPAAITGPLTVPAGSSMLASTYTLSLLAYLYSPQHSHPPLLLMWDSCLMTCTFLELWQQQRQTGLPLLGNNPNSVSVCHCPFWIWLILFSIVLLKLQQQAYSLVSKIDCTQKFLENQTGIR